MSSRIDWEPDPDVTPEQLHRTLREMMADAARVPQSVLLPSRVGGVLVPDEVREAMRAWAPEGVRVIFGDELEAPYDLNVRTLPNGAPMWSTIVLKEKKR